MATTPKINIDFASMKESVASQFKGLNPNDPSTWPALPRYALCLAVAAAVVVGLWFAWLNSSDEELKVEQAKELTLKEDYKKKLVQAINLDALKKQREQVQQYVTQLEKQLPSKAEMDALLSDINQAGLGRSLLFESFKPQAVNVKEFYAELPIDLKVVGRYHDLAAFASDIANLSRIVTLNINYVNGMQTVQTKDKDSNLTMEATARTYRYLDPEEVLAQRKATAPGANK